MAGLRAQPVEPPVPPTAPAAAARPKVCLVLSGGGARGAAHVGVLKVLERLQVPIDCIAGTSMGSIVGAAYASGTPIDEMEAIIASMSTRLLFKELPPREERSVRLKQDDTKPLAPVELGYRDGKLLMPKGLVSGVQLETVLRGLSKVQGFHRFDQLPIPFRAVATDLVTGKPVVLSQGELPSAMRASMSVPGAIDPVRLDGRLLVDGGLTNNLPVDVARAMGADIVIAVNLGTPLLKPEALNSILGVTGQMVNILTEQNVQASLASLKPSDVLVLPNLGDFSAADFDDMSLTVPVGEAATLVVAEQLARLSVSPAQYAAWSKRRLAGSPAAIEPVDEIRFAELQHVNPQVARSVMVTQPAAAVEQQTLDRDMRLLYGTGDFEHVNYRLLEEPGKRVLAVDAIEKSWGPNYLRLGLGLSSDFGGDAFFNLLASYRMTWLNSLGGQWYSEVQIGRNNRIDTEFFQPLEPSQTFFVVPSAGYGRRTLDVFDADQRVASYDLRTGHIALETGAQFTKYGELRLGLISTDTHTRLDTGPAIFEPPQERTRQVALSLRASVDQLDSANFPRSGYGGSLQLLSARKSLGGDADFARAEARGSYAVSFGEHTFNFGFKLGQRIGSDPLPTNALFQWGGLLQQSGYSTGALLGEELRFARIGYYKRLARWSLLDGVYGGLSLEAGRVGKPLVPNNEQGTLRSFALTLGVDTPLGPLYFGYGRANRGYDSLYLFLGRP
ncbi:patatin-like phospholipase family protein [Roseateles violae]|uniref:Patatin-like phospholipase family protein n=1 Tax=Roseateles violae TaxID=3058042 RepID=A0ABT8DZR8_9BURK|nr:patatin-like phospholipase family protein [Pelomonas sp. PFR6]MDN3923101.1 patatin-like phospholipase family protein [Pelomonas sp. PFR6]